MGKKSYKYKIEMKHMLADMFKIVKRAWKPFLGFVILSVFLNIFVVQTLFRLFLQVSMKVRGLSYIASDNFVTFFFHPITLFLFLVVMILYGLITMFQVSALIYGANLSYHGRKATFGPMCACGLKGAEKLLKPKNWLTILYLLFLIPFTNVVNLSSGGLSVTLPEFITDFIKANTTLFWLCTIGCLALALVALYYIFAIFKMVLEGEDFRPACKVSKVLFKKYFLLAVVFLVLVRLALYLAGLALSSFVISIIFAIQKNLLGADSTKLALMTKGIFSMAAFFSSMFGPVLSISGLTALYNRVEEKEGTDTEALIQERTLTKKSYASLVVILAVVVGLNFAARPEIFYCFDQTERPMAEVIAHRGDSLRKPENTIPAFDLAIMEEADWIELDVHQTKDGVLVVSHDDDLTRVSGKSVYVHDLTYDEIQKIDTGSWFSNEYSYLRLATLDQVLKLCKDKIKVEIEIKPTEYDRHLEEDLLKVINDNGMHDQVAITSLKTAPLKRIKELDPTMHTIYTMTISLNSVDGIDFADAVSVEASNVSPALVDSAHKAGKKIYVWTVNNEDEIQYLVDCGVDGILTDDPIMLEWALGSASYNDGIPRMCRLFLNYLQHGY